jgi:alkylation response protein AidB-like acyl-CoA dehydrogenase
MQVTEFWKGLLVKTKGIDMANKLAIEFSDEQTMLLETASAFCAEKSSSHQVRALLKSETGFDADVWQAMAELGWQGITVPEALGGSALGMAELITIVESMGRHLMATPLISTTLAQQALICAGSEQQKNDWLPRLADGSAIGTLALTEDHGDWDLTNIRCHVRKEHGRLHLSGTKTFVADAQVADIILVSASLDGSPALLLLDKSAFSESAISRETVIDETRRSYRLQLDGISLPESALLAKDKTNDCLKLLELAACLLLAAEMAGGIAGVLNLTLGYLNTRPQFGRLIGSNQALKHPMVDVLCGLEYTRSHLYHAACIFGLTQEAEIAIRMAKAQAVETFAYAGDRSVQFHGGIGFTYECDAQLYLRRALWCQYQNGDAQYQRAHLASLLLG